MCLPEGDGKRRRSWASRGRARPWLRRGPGGSGEEAAPRPSSAGAGGGGRPACGRGGRGLSQGPRPAPFACLSPPLFSCRSPLPPPAGRADSAPSRGRARARPRVPVLPVPRPRPVPFSPPTSPCPTSVAEMAGSPEPTSQPDFPFSPGLPHSLPDVSWRKPIYPNGE